MPSEVGRQKPLRMSLSSLLPVDRQYRIVYRADNRVKISLLFLGKWQKADEVVFIPDTGSPRQFPPDPGNLAANLIVPGQEVNMTKTNKIFTLLVILAMAAASTVSLGAAEKQAAASGDKLVNINTADAAQLDTLPRIGLKMAQRILDYRKSNGNFKRVQDLMKVKGIGEKVFAKLQPLITI
jgi:comEA protein